MASTETVVSREEKEAKLNERIDEIRRRNAALQKRYEEVQADKKNADIESDGISSSPRIRSQPLERCDDVPKAERRLKISERLGNIRAKPQAPSDARHGLTIKSGEQQQQPQRRTQRLREDDGPPPDPTYNFLADRTRNRETSDDQDETEDIRHRGSRRHTGNYGGKDFANAKVEMQKRRSYERTAPWKHSSNSKMDLELSMTGRERGEYERWRSERKVIEEARVNRQRTTSGEWSREWDKEKDHRQIAPKRRTSSNWKNAKQKSAEDEHTEAAAKELSTPDRFVTVSNDTLNISITNERTVTEDVDDVQECSTEQQQTLSPSAPTARAYRRWGSEDAWEDAGQWEDCEPDDECETFQGHPDDDVAASAVTENAKDTLKPPNENTIASDDSRQQVGEQDPTLKSSPSKDTEGREDNGEGSEIETPANNDKPIEDDLQGDIKNSEQKLAYNDHTEDSNKMDMKNTQSADP